MSGLGARTTESSDVAISTVIVDDQDDIRLLLRLVLSGDDQIDLTGEASNGEDALDRCAELEPEVLVLDQMMPGMSGLDVVRELRRRGSTSRVLLCTAYLSDALREEALGVGVEQCISKLDVTGIPSAIRHLAAAM
jgi:DNA-binding NarL/FixJ family response regulator